MERGERLVIEAVHVAGISDGAKTEAQAVDTAMALAEGQHRNGAARAHNHEGAKRFVNFMRIQDRRIIAARRLVETIAELCHQAFPVRPVGPHIDAAFHVERDGAEIIHAMGLIGVIMCDQYAVYSPDMGIQQLLAQVGRGVDQDAGFARC